ncbi:MAG: hypothetical protein IT494_06995 [Gammaproteobacteria bacterium]|nr:hypothetical protein [Gammaproteobacteria bacterium]
MSLIYIHARCAAPLVLALLTAAAPAAWAADPCDDFTWPVAQEREIFAGNGVAVTAGLDAGAAPALAVARLYTVQLAEQPAVQFAAEPGKQRLNDGAHAGLVRFTVPQPGRYRVAAGSAVWIDLVSDNQLLSSRDFRGVQGCQAPHKIVEYDLPQAGSYLLQLSASAPQSVSVALTQAPAAND